MKRVRYFISALLIAAMSMSFLACSSKKDEKSTGNAKELDSDLRNEIRQNAEKSELLTGDKLENGEIKWLSDWDINPDGTGKNVPIDLAVFQERHAWNSKTRRSRAAGSASWRRRTAARKYTPPRPTEAPRRT